MPRFARVVVPECPHHVTQRGNARRDVFFTNADRHVYLGLLEQYAELYGLDVLGYCLMTNHVHLVLLPYEARGMAKFMREVQMRYAQYRHALERGCGHLWQGRYYSCAVDPRHLGTVMRYVELNPVRAGMVAEASAYCWSSAGVHLGLERGGIVAMDYWRRCWTEADWAAALQAGEQESSAIREATYGGRPLGSDDFVKTLERKLDRRLVRGVPGRPKKQMAVAAKI